MNGMAPPPLGDFIKKRDSEASTRSVVRGDCAVQFRKSAFAQNVLSIKGSINWNTLPTVIRGSRTYILFKKQLKTWLNNNQNCDH